MLQYCKNPTKIHKIIKNYQKYKRFSEKFSHFFGEYSILHSLCSDDIIMSRRKDVYTKSENRLCTKSKGGKNGQRMDEFKWKSCNCNRRKYGNRVTYNGDAVEKSCKGRCC